MLSMSSGALAQSESRWQNVNINQQNREPRRANFFAFENLEKAQSFDKKKSANYLSMEGMWKFNFVKDHNKRPANFFALKYDDSQWKDFPVPGLFELNGYGDATYKNIGYAWATQFDPNPPYISELNNYTGSYRRTFELPKDWKGKDVYFHVGSATSNLTLWVNGKYVGYSEDSKVAAEFNISKYLKPGKNLIAMQVMRWCDGSYFEDQDFWRFTGIAREVYLYARPKLHAADIRLNAALENNYQDGVLNYQVSLKGGKTDVSITLRDKDGKQVAEATGTQGVIKVPKVKAWTGETPYLYKLVTRLYRNNRLIDQTQQKVGIRTVRVAQYDGFQLNGKQRKIKGVCLHHDLGPLGAAVNKAALIRQIRTMKDMGCDAIRTAHNMPSTWQMEVCDSMGMMVMAESFDMWIYPKCKNGYALNFKEWADRDIENLVRNHRNHPSIVMWSIGNEIPEQWSEEGRQISEHLQALCHKYDPTRPVTQGMDQAEAALGSGFAQVMDVPGFNYRVHKYDNNIRQLPKGFLLGSETASTVSSRGVYKFPVEPSDSKKYADGQCSSYDVEYCPWSNLPDDDWRMQDDRDYVIGEFVWTGYDYLGEPSPYDEYWPSRSSYFGICDLAGLPKDRFWLYRSHWRTDVNTLHVLPHWTFPGREGEVTPVYCYTNAPSAELFVNGKSQGRIVKNPGTRLDRYRLRWNNVKYEPGELKVVAYNYDGSVMGEQTVRTAGEPARIVLEADRSSIAAKGEDLAFVKVSVVDKDGTPCPTATNKMKFEVTGTAKFRAACNGDATSLVAFNSTEMPLFSGELVVVVEGTKQGKATLSVSAEGLPKETLSINIK